MKYVIGILIAFLLLPGNIYGQQEGNIVLNTEITIRATDQPISTVLDSLSKKASIYFSYDPVSIGADKKVSLSIANTSLGKILDIIFDQQCNFFVSKDQLVIIPKDKNSKELPPQKTPEFILLQGHLLDLSNNTPIPYASVSIFRQPIGTMTNLDGDFELKISPEKLGDTLVFSCLGYQRYYLPIKDFELEKNNIFLNPVSIKIKEIKVRAIEPTEIITKLIENIGHNYPVDQFLMTTFYRETLKQDEKYINISEAVMEIMKASYMNDMREDQTKIIKGRKNKEVQPFKWVDFKIMGGPYYITQLDVIKTMETFLNPETIDKYKYEIEEVIFYQERPTFVVQFKPRQSSDYYNYTGKLYIDRENYALVKAEYHLDKSGLKMARQTMIKKKPRGLYVKPTDVNYTISYKFDCNKWHLYTAQTNILFRVKSRNDRINSVFQSNSDLLVTNCEKSDLRRFKRSETFHSSDVFTETIIDFDENFWENYNTIKPHEDLRNAIKLFK